MTTTDIVGYSHDGGHQDQVGADTAILLRRAIAQLGPSGRAQLCLAWKIERSRGRPEVGSWIDDAVSTVSKGYKSTVKFAKKAAKSPILKVATGVLIVVAPAIGLPLAAGLATANKVLDAAELPPDPKAPAAVQQKQAARQVAAKKLVKATLREAHAGHPGAKAAVRDMKIVLRERRASPKHLRSPRLKRAASFKGVLVLRDGTIVKGIYRNA